MLHLCKLKGFHLDIYEMLKITGAVMWIIIKLTEKNSFKQEIALYYKEVSNPIYNTEKFEVS